MLLQGDPGRAQDRSGRSELEPHVTWWADFVAPVISRVLDEAKTEAPDAVQVEPWSDEANVVRRRPLLHLDSDVIVVGLYDHADDITALVQIRVPHRVGDDLADGEADVVETTVEHRWRDGLVQRGSGQERCALVRRQDHLSA